ncbi:MAG: hypothetical protein EOP56_18090 [Sphingobacteriales bacterium]|nr:MAG: hypothetical protein EOP56_18090 [Sphingobacteriales bacterium]
MELNVIIRVAITQQPITGYASRNEVFSYDLSCGFDSISTWENITDTLKISLPKYVYALDQDGRPFPMAGSNRIIGGDEGSKAGFAPLFLKGDYITVNWGYRYIKTDGNEETILTGTNGQPNLFEGVITEVGSNMPIELKAEDYMYHLKQIPAKSKSWKGYDLQKMLKELIQGNQYGITVRDDAQITLQYNIGSFSTNAGETVAQVVARLRNEYGLYFYMRGKQLRGGFPIYYEDEARTHAFAFKKDIVSSNLVYKRKDDVVLSAVGISEYDAPKEKAVSAGESKTKKVRLEVLVTYKNGKFTSVVKKKGEQLPPNLEGERRTFIYNGLTTPEQVIERVKPQLLKYYYTGLRGSFTVIGLPYVKHGDNVTITNPDLPDQDGIYKVKGVKRSATTEPKLRQEITLDYKIQ